MNDLMEWFDEEGKKISSAEPVSSDPMKLANQIAEQKVSLNQVIYYIDNIYFYTRWKDLQYRI